MDLKPELVAFSVGFGVFLSFVGGAVVAPPDPFSQLLVIPALLVATVPVIYHVLDVDSVASLDQKSRLPFPYFVGATITSTGAGLLVPFPLGAGLVSTLARGGAFVGVFFLVSLVTVRHSRARAPDVDEPDQPGSIGSDGFGSGPDPGDTDGGGDGGIPVETDGDDGPDDPDEGGVGSVDAVDDAESDEALLPEP